PSFYSSFGPSINFLFLSFSIVQCNTTEYCIARCTGYLYLFPFSSSSSFSSALSPLVSRATSIQSFVLQLDPQLSEAVCLL
ncbi:hypothetical protein BD560DRAFT_381229, partial [Blakeslea trispora]